MSVGAQSRESIGCLIQSKTLERCDQHHDQQSNERNAEARKGTPLIFSFATGDRSQPKQQEQTEESYCDKFPEAFARIFRKCITFNIDVRLSTKEILELNNDKCNEQSYNAAEHNG